MARVVGIGIDRSNVEGERVAVRGFGPELNLVTLNGRQMPTVPGPNDVQQAHDLDAEYQKELVEEVGYGVDGMVKPNFTMCNLCQRAYLCRILHIVGRPLTWSFLSGKLRIST